MWRTGARAIGAMALVAVAAALTALVAPPVATGDTGGSIPFRAYIRDADIALYRLDRARSSWAVNTVTLVPSLDFLEPCSVTGTFVFERIEAFSGRWPRTLRKVVKATTEDCIWYGEVPTGRSILVANPEYAEYADWWGFGPSGRLQTWGSGAGGPESVPQTLRAWIAALRAPDTATLSADGAGTPPWAAYLVLVLGAAGGLVAGLRRSRPRSARR